MDEATSICSLKITKGRHLVSDQLLQEVLDIARDQLGIAQERARIAKTTLHEAEQVEKVWEAFVQFASRGWYIHILNLLNRHVSIFQYLNTENPDKFLVIERTHSMAKEEAKNIIRRYPELLEMAFKNADPPLDSSSRHPRYTLENGFFRLEIDEQRYVARLSDHEGKLAELPADINAVVEKMRQEHKRIFGRPFDGNKFIKHLRKEYLAIVKKDKQQDGASIPIRRITHRLGKNVKGFRTDEFLIDLSKLAQEGPFEIDGKRLDLQQTKDTKEGMLLYGATGRGYIGFIIFREVQQ
jgi:hypothetical protein